MHATTNTRVSLPPATVTMRQEGTTLATRSCAQHFHNCVNSLRCHGTFCPGFEGAAVVDDPVLGNVVVFSHVFPDVLSVWLVTLLVALHFSAATSGSTITTLTSIIAARRPSALDMVVYDRWSTVRARLGP